VLHRISISLIGIAGICCLIGFGLSGLMIELSAKRHIKQAPPHCVDCGAIYIYLGFFAFIAIPIVAALIASIAAIFYRKPTT
jgi:hypothetical protein